LDSLVPNQDVMIKTISISHRVTPIKQPSSIPLAGLRGSISLSLVIHGDWEILPTAGFISIIVSGPPTPSWQACVRASMGLTLYEKRGRVALYPPPARKEGKWRLALEPLGASAVPIHISLVWFRIDRNELEKNDRRTFLHHLSAFLDHDRGRR
jgi:hypothetical protein